ncbi:MAG: hypothetical protein N3A38_15885, partial [Planctomycetota bacterium]|nr:hypothetical protein [Planctomycetota bacterium]
MRTQHFLRVLVPASLLLAPLLAAGDAPARQEEGEPFTKVETRYLPLPQPMAVETPGLLDPAQRVEVVFPEKGDRINLPIQIDGERVPSAALNGDELWVDLDGDSEKEKGEVFLRSPQGFGPVRCEFSFHDGTKTRYEFILVPAGAPNRLRLVRACAKTAAIEGLQVTILDDDCNGRFDGYGSDSLLVEGHPPSLLSRVICVRGKLYELVAHPAGNTIEYRSYPVSYTHL